MISGTGTSFSIDQSGHIRIVDRKKDMFIIDGLNVYPYEVEDALYRHDAIKDSPMIGVHHEGAYGERMGGERMGSDLKIELLTPVGIFAILCHG